MPKWQMADGARHMLTFHLSNEQPVDLVDLTTSLMALAEEFEEYSLEESGEPALAGMRLAVNEIKSGSIMASLVPTPDQLSWVLDHRDLVAGFVTSLNDLAQYFLAGRPLPSGETPTQQQARRINKISEPVAKDSGSQLNIAATDHAQVIVHQHFHLGSRDANAIQNGVRRFLGPDLPAAEVLRDQLLTLEQVKNVASAKTGDRGIIEAIWPRPVKLQFASEPAKQQVLDLQANPFQKIFICDVEVRSSGGRPAIYRVLNVTDVIDRPS